MNQSDLSFLEANRWAIESYSQSSPPRSMGMMDRERLLKIVRESFDPGASADLWCGECVRVFILNAYIMYDEYIKSAIPSN